MVLVVTCNADRCGGGRFGVGHCYGESRCCRGGRSGACLSVGVHSGGGC